MGILNKRSLAGTLDNLNQAFFYGKAISKTEKTEVAKWLADRQGMPRSYSGMFAPTELDYKNGIKLFTGEKITSGAATGHILGEETCRALILLGDKRAGIKKALTTAQDGIFERIFNSPRTKGTYCCGTCTDSWWRHLIADGFEKHEPEIKAGIKDLKKHRDGKGRWRRYPFYYTLLALSEIDLPLARKEIEYTAPVMERALRRSKSDKYSRRRHDLMVRIMEQI